MENNQENLFYHQPIIQDHPQARRQSNEVVAKPNSNSNPRKMLSLLLKSLIMALVVSLFLLFLGFAALVVIHFLLTSAAFHRPRRRRSSPVSTSRTSLLSSLPCLRYSASAQEVKDCAICLESFKEGDSCRSLPDCGHLFHVKCIDSWLVKVPSCPICRSRVELDPGGHASPLSDDDWKIWWAVGA